MIKVIDNRIVGDVETKELSDILQGYALSRRQMGDELAANLIELAAIRLAEQQETIEKYNMSLLYKRCEDD